jgi:dephospho-CoA kinase
MIVGLTGRIAAGKGVVSDFFKENGFRYLSLSNEVREEATKKGIQHERKNLQDLGNYMRETEGLNVLVKRLESKIEPNNNYIIDGIRNTGEVEELSRLFCNNFYLIAVDASQEIRWRNAQKRGKISDPKTFKEFAEADNRDYEENVGNGQQVRECMARADYFLINEGTIEALRDQIKIIYKEIKHKC